MIAWHVMEQPYEFMPPPAFFALDIGNAMRPSEHRCSPPSGPNAANRATRRNMNETIYYEAR